MPARRSAFGRPRLTEPQMRILLAFDLYRRRVARRPYRPTLGELALETCISVAGVQAHVAALFHKGFLTHEGARYRGYQLSETGLAWCKAKRRRMKRAAKKRAGTPGGRFSLPDRAGLPADGSQLASVPPRTPQGVPT